MGQRAQVIGSAERAVARDIDLIGPGLGSRTHPRVGHVPLHGHDLAGLHPRRAADGLHPQVNRRCRGDSHASCADDGVISTEPALEHVVEGVGAQHQLVVAGQAIRHADLLGHVITLTHAQNAAVRKVAQRDGAGAQGAVRRQPELVVPEPAVGGGVTVVVHMPAHGHGRAAQGTGGHGGEAGQQVSVVSGEQQRRHG